MTKTNTTATATATITEVTLKACRNNHVPVTFAVKATRIFATVDNKPATIMFADDAAPKYVVVTIEGANFYTYDRAVTAGGMLKQVAAERVEYDNTLTEVTEAGDHPKCVVCSYRIKVARNLAISEAGPVHTRCM